MAPKRETLCEICALDAERSDVLADIETGRLRF